MAGVSGGVGVSADWAAVLEFLAPIGISVLSAGALFQIYGKSWIENKFSERLEAFRADKAKEIARLRVEIDGALNARIRLQEKEFLVISEIWSLSQRAYGASFDYVGGAQHFPDFDRYTKEQLREFLERRDFRESTKKEILEAEDPKIAYEEANNVWLSNRAHNAVVELKNFLFLNELFIDEDLVAEVKEIANGMYKAVRSRDMKIHNARFPQGNAFGELTGKCLDDLEALGRRLRKEILAKRAGTDLSSA